LIAPSGDSVLTPLGDTGWAESGSAGATAETCIAKLVGSCAGLQPPAAMPDASGCKITSMPLTDPRQFGILQSEPRLAADRNAGLID
jgi:hypothetical protein